MNVDKSVATELTESAMGKTFLQVFEMLHELIPNVIQRAAAVPNTRVLLVGHSMGGFLAQLNCATYGLHGVTFNAPPLGSYQPKGRYVSCMLFGVALPLVYPSVCLLQVYLTIIFFVVVGLLIIYSCIQ
jgi:alpha-beta hydrolase superfamily lysophospholipase